jgi:hypothetical protein
VKRAAIFSGLVLGLAMGLAGCTAFPKQAAHLKGKDQDQTTKAWKIKSSDRYDYFQYLNQDGKVAALGYDDNRDGQAEVRIDFAAMGTDTASPHYVILLDGIPHQVVEKMYKEGHFRLFYPPSKLVTVFPSNTDVAYEELFKTGGLMGFEASYFDRDTRTVSNANTVYLKGLNAPWEKLVDYRVAKFMDPIGYVNPNFVFDHEMKAIGSLVERKKDGLVIGYSVGTAMVGTREGEAGIRKCLERVEQICEKMVYEKRGRCRISMLADHGHNLIPASYFDVSGALKAKGFHVTKNLSKPGDVICIQYGLLTYNALYTNEPITVASAMLEQEQVGLAFYPVTVAGVRKIVVRDRTGEAMISLGNEGGYRYEIVRGDPLKLGEIIKQLQKAGKVGRDGTLDDRALFEATVDHVYPDPLARLWRAFNGMVKYPPDLVLMIQDGWFTGDSGFAGTGRVASTHGSLKKLESVTFVMSTIRPLAKAARTEELLREFPEITPTKK